MTSSRFSQFYESAYKVTTGKTIQNFGIIKRAINLQICIIVSQRNNEAPVLCLQSLDFSVLISLQILRTDSQTAGVSQWV